MGNLGCILISFSTPPCYVGRSGEFSRLTSFYEAWRNIGAKTFFSGLVAEFRTRHTAGRKLGYR